MIIDLSKLPWRLSNDIVMYCWVNQIEPLKCFNYMFKCVTDEDLIFDIPDKHITWMMLKDILVWKS